MKTKKKQPAPELAKTIETFRCPFGWTLSQMLETKPSCWNGSVSVLRYRVTAELIEEPDEVIRGRIRKLWRECDNFHHWTPLKAMAAKYGLELDHDECGKDAHK